MIFAEKGKSYYMKKVPSTGIEAVAVVSTQWLYIRAQGVSLCFHAS